MLHAIGSETLSAGDDFALLGVHHPESLVGIDLPPPSSEQYDPELATRILQRIEARLPCRVRNLAVLTTERAVFLTGRCSTFYTKQLAQHVAMGALDYEQLVNQIEVRVAK